VYLYRVKKQNLNIEYPIVLDNKETLLIEKNTNRKTSELKIKNDPDMIFLIDV
jgi:hypothetical protein